MFEYILTLKPLTTNMIDPQVVDGCLLSITKTIISLSKGKKGCSVIKKKLLSYMTDLRQ